jgi:hypothetical protein
MTLQPPDPTLLKVSDALDAAIAVFERDRLAAAPTGEWEAPVEAWNLATLVVRTLGGLSLMAHTDMALAPPAMQCARAALEHTVRAVWLLQPPDRFVAEVRWLALLHEWEQFEDRLAHEADSANIRDRHEERRDSLLQFRLEVAARLPDGYRPSPRLPSMRSMMVEIGIGSVYGHYRTLSQPVHGTMDASQFYRRNLGTEMVLGEFGGLKDWILPMRLSWVGMRNLRHLVLSRCGQRPVRVPDDVSASRRVDEAFTAMAVRAAELLAGDSP